VAKFFVTTVTSLLLACSEYPNEKPPSSSDNSLAVTQNQTLKIILEIEKSIHLPEGKNINKFDRYYYGTSDNLNGFYINNGKAVGSVSLVDENDVPFGLDGDCKYIHVNLNLQTKEIIDVFCNGGA
jgi:hypothetical protein